MRMRLIVQAIFIGSVVSILDASSITLQDEEVSTKEIGILQWQYFFQMYVESTTPSEPTAYDANIHVCWFQFFLRQWAAGNDERYAVTAIQNCPPELIKSFTFTIYTPGQTGERVYDKDTPAGCVVPTGVNDVVLMSFSSEDPDRFFGVLMNKAYTDSDDFKSQFDFDYTIQEPDNESSGESFSGPPSASAFVPLKEYTLSDSSQAFAPANGVDVTQTEEYVGNGNMSSDVVDYAKVDGLFQLPDAFINAGGVRITQMAGASGSFHYGCRKFTFTNDAGSEETTTLGECSRSPQVFFDSSNIGFSPIQSSDTKTLSFVSKISDIGGATGDASYVTSSWNVLQYLQDGTQEWQACYGKEGGFEEIFTWDTSAMFCGLDYIVHTFKEDGNDEVVVDWRPLECIPAPPS